jgi:hypothetical protein
LDDFSGQRADISSAVPFDLRFVAKTADGKSIERFVHRIRDRMSDARFADARRTDEQQYAALRILLEFTHR